MPTRRHPRRLGHRGPELGGRRSHGRGVRPQHQRAGARHHPEQAAPALPQGRPQDHERQGRLLGGCLRHLHHHGRRPRREGLRPHHQAGPGPRHHHLRGPDARGAGGLRLRLRRLRSRPVRLLHPGHGHGRRRPVPPQPRPDGPPDCRGHPRQRLPLHRLQAHPGGHQARRRHPAWRREDRPGRGARRRLRRGQADLPRGRPQEGPGLWPVPGRHHREGLPGHVLRLGRALQVRPRPRGQDRLIQGRGHGGRHRRAHGRRRAPQPGGPPHPGLGRHDRRGRRHPLRRRRRLPGGCRDARDS